MVNESTSGFKPSRAKIKGSPTWLCSGDNDRAGLYEKEAALKLAEEKKHQADANNAAYKAANLAKLTVSEVQALLLYESLLCQCACMNDDFALAFDIMPQLGSYVVVL